MDEWCLEADGFRARRKLFPCLDIPDGEADGVRPVGGEFVEGPFLDALGAVAEIPMEYEGDGGCAAVLELRGEEDGFRSAFLRGDQHAGKEEAALPGILCGEDGECLREGSAVGGCGVERDIPLFRGIREPEVQRRPGGLEERPGIIIVVCECAVVVGIIPRVEIQAQGKNVGTQGCKEEEFPARGEDDAAVAIRFR